MVVALRLCWCVVVVVDDDGGGVVSTMLCGFFFLGALIAIPAVLIRFLLPRTNRDVDSDVPAPFIWGDVVQEE